MKTILKFSGFILCAALLFSCNDEQIIKGNDLPSAIAMESIEFDLPDDVRIYAYPDPATGQAILPVVSGSNVQLEFSITPAPDLLTFPDMRWSSSDEEVVSVSQQGQITALAPGNATITVTTAALNVRDRGTAALRVLVVDQTVPATRIRISDDAIAEVEGRPACYIGESMQLSAAITPSSATFKGVLWSSGDEEIATVDKITGVVRGVSRGNVTITATALDAENPVTDTHDIYVDQIINPVAIRVNNVAQAARSAMNEGGITLLFDTYPENCTRSIIEWTTSDEAIATVRNGVVEFHGFGQVNITATCRDEGEEIPAGYEDYKRSVIVPIDIPEGYLYEHFENSSLNWWQVKTSGTRVVYGYNDATGENYAEYTPNKANANTLRGDNGANTGAPHSVVTLHSGNFPIICLRFDDVNDKYGYTRNINLDTSGNRFDGTAVSGNFGGSNNKWSKKYLCSDGSAIIIYDLKTQGFATGGILPENSSATLRTFQLKYADIRKSGNVNFEAGETGMFRVYWIETFESEEVLGNYLYEWSERTGITYDPV